MAFGKSFDARDSLAPRFRSVLFICAANTARSVIAEHLLKRELKTLGADGHVLVRSAGIAPFARDGALVSLDTRLVLREEGIEIGEHAVSTNLARHPEMLESADLVLAMTGDQALDLRKRFPLAAERPVFTLHEFAGETGDIEDPFEKGEQVFAACREEIKRLLPRIIGRILGVR
jgi:protein-tyrosine-phosphatase